MSKVLSAAAHLPVNPDMMAGMDAGGTKVVVLDTIGSQLHRFSAPDYPDMYAVLEAYFTASEVRPCRVAIAIGGLRDDETGDVQTTNVAWPIFRPAEAARRYPGTEFVTMHDLASVASGALHVSSMDVRQLKTGAAKRNGPIIAVTIGTGVGVSVAIWEPLTKRRIFFSGEAGHMGFQPYNEAQQRHLAHLYTRFDHPSIELAINGKHGIVAWLVHSPELQQASRLRQALKRAEAADRPVGAVLLEFATEGNGVDRKAARTILDHAGTLVGNALADFALAYRSTGGIYLTGSVSLGLAEYWAEHTDFAKAFVRHGTADHAPWVRDFFNDIPIKLITDPNISAAGALAVAKEQS